MINHSMTTIELLTKLYQLNVKLWVEGDQLSFNAPQEVMTPVLHSEIAKRKAEIIHLLQGISATKDEQLSIPRAPREKLLPLSYAQQRLWFLAQLAPEHAWYNVPLALHLDGLCDHRHLEQSLNQIIKRHESLRTCFIADQHRQPGQLILPELLLPLQVRTIPTGIPALERQAFIQEQLQREASRSFDLQRGPLLRVTLWKLGEQEHILLLCFHHIIFDEWSMGIFLRELEQYYAAALQGHQSPLPDLPVQYADFALWQRNWLQGEVMQRQQSYWQKQLEGAPTILALLADRPRPAVQSFRGAHVRFALSPTLTQALKTLSQRENVTLFMTLLAAFQTLLWRYSGQTDLLVGSPIANRVHGNLEHLIGFFMNTLVLRADLSGNPSFRQLLARVRTTTLAAYAHQDMPFEQLVEAVQPERTLSHSPLIQVMFTFQNAPQSILDLQGLKVRPLELENKTAKADLALGMVDTEQGLRGTWEYATDLFEAATISRLVEHFQRLLEGISNDPDQPLELLPLLSPAERQQLLVEWNATARPFPQDQCLHQLFEQQVERSSDAPAVAFEDHCLTYQELNRRANQLAHHLQRLGVGPEVCVGLCLHRSLDLLVGLLAILKAGGAYVPLDPDYPQERLAFLLADARVSLTLTHQHLLTRFPEQTTPLLCLDADWPLLMQQPVSNPSSRVQPTNLAYVTYTSGSTGQPKGVASTHLGVLNLVNWHQQAYQLTATDRNSQQASFAFDASVWEMWPSLLTGASLHLLNEEARIAPQQLHSWLHTQAITLCFLPSPLAERMFNLSWPAGGTLRYLLTGADRLRHAPTSALPFQLVNHYGPTESTVIVTAGTVAAAEEAAPPPTIGRPLANTQLYVLDAQLQPVPLGVPGELYLGSVGLARGYLHHPELTAERFLPHPFSEQPGARLYRTGDLVRYRPDGSLDFLGRRDSQVKLRGYRIELGEIESLLHGHPAVGEAVALLTEQADGEQRLLAYVVPCEGQVVTSSQLRDYLKAKLPSYMIPGAFVILEKLPITPNGKLDRRALPAPTSPLYREGIEPLVALGPVEELLVDLWAEVLSSERIGPHENFFELGGHSLLATEIISWIYEVFQVKVPLRTFFETPTIAALSALLLQNPGERPRIERIAQTLLKLTSLSETDVETLLDGKSLSSQKGRVK